MTRKFLNLAHRAANHPRCTLLVNNTLDMLSKQVEEEINGFSSAVDPVIVRTNVAPPIDLVSTASLKKKEVQTKARSTKKTWLDKSDCVATYEYGKEQLQNVLNEVSSRVSLTVDFWTSKQTLGYLFVTCRFIMDNWIIHTKKYKFALVETPHDGRNIINAMFKSLNEWNLEYKVFTITLDNSSNNDPFVKCL